jgi:hypothetical protein
MDGQRGHKMVRSGSQGIPIRRQKKQKNISVICPQNHKWGFSPCPSLTPIISGTHASYGEMGEVKTTWFEPRRGRTEKGILRRKKSVGNMAQQYPPRGTCVSYVMTQLPLTKLCKFTTKFNLFSPQIKIYQFMVVN